MSKRTNKFFEEAGRVYGRAARAVKRAVHGPPSTQYELVPPSRTKSRVELETQALKNAAMRGNEDFWLPGEGVESWNPTPRPPARHVTTPTAREEALISRGIGPQPEKVYIGNLGSAKYFTSPDEVLFWVDVEQDKAREEKASYLERDKDTYGPDIYRKLKGFFKQAAKIRAAHGWSRATTAAIRRATKVAKPPREARQKAAPRKITHRQSTKEKPLNTAEVFRLVGIK